MNSYLLINIPTTISGPRVQLRMYVAADAAAIQEAVTESRSELVKVFTWAMTDPSLEQRMEGLVRGTASWTLKTEFGFGIWLPESNRYLGDIGIFNPDWNVRRFEIGYWLRTSAVGKGYATEAARLLCDMAFNTFEARRVFIQCDAENAASCAVPLRLGFEHEGVLRSYGLRPSGQVFDLSIFGMTPDRWRNPA